MVKNLISLIVAIVGLHVRPMLVTLVRGIDRIFRNDVLNHVEQACKYKKYRKYLRRHYRNLVEEHILTDQELDPDGQIKNDLFKAILKDMGKRDWMPPMAAFALARADTERLYHKAIVAEWKKKGLVVHYMENIGFIIRGTMDSSNAEFMRVGKEIRVLHEAINILTELGVIKTKKGWVKSSGMDKIHGKIINTPWNLAGHGRAKATFEEADQAKDRPERDDPIKERMIELLKAGINLSRFLRIELWDHNFYKLDVVAQDVDRRKEAYYAKLLRPYPDGYGIQRSWINPLPNRAQDQASPFTWMVRPYLSDPADLMEEVWLRVHEQADIHPSESGGLLDVSKEDMDLLRAIRTTNRWITWVSGSFGFMSPDHVTGFSGRFMVRLFTINDQIYPQVWWVEELSGTRPLFKRVPNMPFDSRDAKFLAVQIEGGIHDEILTGLGYPMVMVPVGETDDQDPIVTGRVKRFKVRAQLLDKAHHLIQKMRGRPKDRPEE